MAASERLSFDTPNIQADQAGLLIHATVRIGAPASLVFRSLRNTETWKDWNKFVPRVEITYQPPEEDLATAAEIEQLVRDTSIAGSYDSDLTDGLVGGEKLRTRLSESNDRPETPPLRLRMNSQASRGSQGDGNEANPTPPNGTGTPERKMSAAQMFAAAQDSRRGSTASGMSGSSQSKLKPMNKLDGPGFIAQPNTEYLSSRHRPPPPEIDPSGRRKSKTPSLQKAMKARQESLHLLYGEPSIRLQLNTRMTFFTRMNPQNPREYRQVHFAVTEVSRPDEPQTDGTDLTQLTRSKTHTLNRSSVYRIVWAMDSTLSSMSNIKNGAAFPKSLLVTERVHEVRPILLGNGTEECELRTWELQKGPVAKVVKKKYGDYLQACFESWAKGLGDFCEAMTGKVDRKDFVILENDISSVGTITF